MATRLDDVLGELIELAIASPTTTDIEAVMHLMTLYGWADISDVSNLMWCLGAGLHRVGMTNDNTWGSARDKIVALGTTKATNFKSILARDPLTAKPCNLYIRRLDSNRRKTTIEGDLASIDSGAPASEVVARAVAFYKADLLLQGPREVVELARVTSTITALYPDGFGPDSE